MTKTQRVAAAAAIGAMLAGSVGGFALASAQRPTAVRYVLRSDAPGMPGSIILRHCGPTEDSYREPLRTVDYDGSGRLILRCATP